MNHDNPSTPARTPGLSRRQVMITGAWAAPLLVLATATPAAAASGGQVANMYDFGNSGATSTWVAPANRITGFNGRANFQAQWNNTAPITSATLVVTVPATGLVASGAIGSMVTVTGGSPNWSVSSAVLSGSNMVYTFTFVGSVAADATSATLQYRLFGDGTTYVSAATPKTAGGVLSSTQFPSVNGSTTWYG